ncbi:hypothetical protein AA0X95_18755 [Bacillus sp. 1P10SD]|uniref:hypothetical protein n=1 Tax=Bacillus sp. 1P10SD TaxID=3132265 RepID=UPI0039A7378A
MLQTLKKIQAEKINSENQVLETFQSVKSNKIEQLNRFASTYKESLERHLYVLQKIDGIPLWRVNYQLNRLADKGISKEQLKSGKIVLSLPTKQSGDIVSEQQKKLIEKKIDELEGFENLRLSQFYSYKPVYNEKKTFSQVSRWIEIEISEL